MWELGPAGEDRAYCRELAGVSATLFLPGSKEATTTLHMLTLLKDLLPCFPEGLVKSCSETLLRVMTLSHVVSSGCKSHWVGACQGRWVHSCRPHAPPGWKGHGCVLRELPDQSRNKAWQLISGVRKTELSSGSWSSWDLASEIRVEQGRAIMGLVKHCPFPTSSSTLFFLLLLSFLPSCNH